MAAVAWLEGTMCAQRRVAAWWRIEEMAHTSRAGAELPPGEGGGLVAETVASRKQSMRKESAFLGGGHRGGTGAGEAGGAGGEEGRVDLDGAQRWGRKVLGVAQRRVIGR
jgi:hypothetical protein